ncbi:hypothetical protein Taro_003751 [Colocasia esculenta]|uniref:Prolyl 4-hydroxylase alpha subunit domain-containing protein n=1 Tax=Colocasia esculenta TaxID=4460 RepID=A0A843TPS3_COLES|nr:hypothetical protein [Colocasia esculenta]
MVVSSLQDNQEKVQANKQRHLETSKEDSKTSPILCLTMDIPNMEDMTMGHLLSFMRQRMRVLKCQIDKGIKSDVRTSSGMFLSSEERKYPIIQFNLKRGGQRIATMLMYLSDNVEGGETYFPMGLDGNSDPKSVHGGCEVLKGEKWSATKWMRQRTSV